MSFSFELNKYKQHNGESINEDCIEKALIQHLVDTMGYKYRSDIKNQDQLKKNFRENIERLNNYSFDDNDFNLWWEEFNSGDVFKRFITLKSNPYMVKDKTTNKTISDLKYFDDKNIENNNFEIINQMWTVDKNTNSKRFDINILINGIPIIHIELKNESIDLKQAMKQIVNYKNNGAISDFLDFTKIFIYSNGTNTRYFVNNNNKNNNSSFTWSDKNNKNANELLEFSTFFLNKSFLIDFIFNYFVMDDEKSVIKIFRPYQYHACKEVLNRIDGNEKQKSGYIWHATGSGKTMTSFKVCEILAKNNPKIELVVFLIDRVDLNDQTFKNFKKFTIDKELIKNAINANNLIELLVDSKSERKIIITTIQKLNKALKNDRESKIQKISNKNIVFVIDECHRSQVGSMRDNINKFFTNAVNFAFTGTPIFDINAKDGKTTENIFGPLIHKYTSYNAIVDKNVLPITYTYSQSIKLENDDASDYFEDELEDNTENLKTTVIDYGKIKEIVNYVNENYDKLTRDKKFNAMFACSSIPEAISYYNEFKAITDLRVAIVFWPNKSEYLENSNCFNDNATFIMDRIKEYNETWDLENLDAYKRCVQEDFCNENSRKYDLLIVVSMLLTGFDSPITNTLFLDKKLRYQGLVQAVSRTNRLYNGKESGYVVSFRTSIETVEMAFELYTNGGINTPIGELFWKPQTYEIIKNEFNTVINALLNKFPSIEISSDIKLEEEKKDFLYLFGEVMNCYNKIKPIPNFDWNDFGIDDRKFNAYRGIYKTIIDKKGNIIYVYNDYEISDLETIEINGKYLKNLLNSIKAYHVENIPENIEDFEIYKRMAEDITNNAKNNDQKLLLLNFIKQKELFLLKSLDEIYILWNKYMKEVISNTTHNAMKRWKASSQAITLLIEQYKLKSDLDQISIEKELPNYIKDPYTDDEKYKEVKLTIQKLITLDMIKDNVLI